MLTADTFATINTISDPHDRAGKATTSLIKSGTGKWILSGANTFTGATTVKQGTLVLATARSLGKNAKLAIADGATVELNFEGQMNIHSLAVNGQLKPPGKYDANSVPNYISGTGVLNVGP